MQVSSFCQSSLSRLCIFQRLLIPIHTSTFINHVKSSRCLHLSKPNYTEVRMSKRLKKMLDKGPKKKKWYLTPVSSDGNPTTFHKSVSAGDKRRANHIGNLLMRHIIPILNSGELSEELANANIEIAKVRVVPDFSQVLVYWHATGTPKDDEFQTVFDKSAKKLRHLITSTYIVGNVPPIQFIKDLSQTKFLEVENRLKKADFGAEYKPKFVKIVQEDFLEGGSENASSRMADDFQKLSNKYVSDGLKDVVDFQANGDDNVAVSLELESSQQHDTDFIEDSNLDIEMRQDLYGLNREEMLRKLNANRSLTRKMVPVSENDEDADIPHVKTSPDDYAKLLKAKYKSKHKQAQYDLRDYVSELEEEQK